MRGWLGAALLAIAVAAATLAVLGYLSLRQWDASAELLFREQARDMASMAAEKAEMLLRQAEEDALDRIALVLADRDFSPAGLDTLRRATPLVRDVYLVDRRGAVLYPRSGDPAARAVADVLHAEIPDGFWERGGRRHVVAGDPVLAVAVLKTFSGGPCLVALTRDADVLRREVFEPALSTTSARARSSRRVSRCG